MAAPGSAFTRVLAALDGEWRSTTEILRRGGYAFGAGSRSNVLATLHGLLRRGEVEKRDVNSRSYLWRRV